MNESPQPLRPAGDIMPRQDRIKARKLLWRQPDIHQFGAHTRIKFAALIGLQRVEDAAGRHAEFMGQILNRHPFGTLAHDGKTLVLRQSLVPWCARSAHVK